MSLIELPKLYVHISVLMEVYIFPIFLLAAKKFGVNEFVNPKDHDKPVQEVSACVIREKN